MMGLEFTGEIPFSRVNVHTVIQAPDGRRMSKSLGTGIDPMQLIEGGPRPPVFAEGGDFPAYGADAVRWGLLAISSSQDVRFNEERVAQGRQLANKLYNASRLVLLRVPEDVDAPRRPRRRRRRSRTAGSSRACRPPSADVARGDRRLRLPRGRAAASTTSSTASCATGTSSCSSRACTSEDNAEAGGASRCTCWARRWRSRTR